MKKLITSIVKYAFVIFMVVCFGIVINQRIHDEDPTLFNHTIYIVLTDSMTGTYEVDDIILVRHTDPENIKNGDAITYHAVEGAAKGMTITHRVVQEPTLVDGKYVFQTRGDKSVATDDPPISEEHVVGKVVTKLYVFSFIYKMFKSVYGFIFIFVIAAMMFIVYAIKMKQEAKEEKSENEASKESKQNC